MNIQNPFPDQCFFHWEKISSQTEGVHPLELKIAERFGSDRRRAEFITGRRCARMVLEKAGIPWLPVFRNQNRSPAWPFAVKGSIAHGGGIAAAIIGKRNQSIKGVGLDLEDLKRKLKTDISRHILTNREKEIWLQDEETREQSIKMIFSIKEAVYKCLQPIQGISLGFHDAEIESIEEGSFRVRILKNPLYRSMDLPFYLNGRISVGDGMVFSAVLADERVFDTQD